MFLKWSTSRERSTTNKEHWSSPSHYSPSTTRLQLTDSPTPRSVTIQSADDGLLPSSNTGSKASRLKGAGSILLCPQLTIRRDHGPDTLSSHSSILFPTPSAV